MRKIIDSKSFLVEIMNANRVGFYRLKWTIIASDTKMMVVDVDLKL